MNLIEFVNAKNDKLFSSVKEMTLAFNKLEVEDRKLFLDTLTAEQRKEFVNTIREQAVIDFWINERELIKKGECTRDWTPEQIECIMNISTKTGKERTTDGRAIVLDKDGNPVMKIRDGKLINEVYEGHHMLNVNDHPEYAGDYRNIQALARSNGEHIAAHDGNFHNETDQYYDINYHDETGQYDGANKGLSKIENAAGEVDFEEFWESNRMQCIFKSDADMKNLYDNFDDLTAGEQLALKNADLALENGDFEKFKAANDLAEKYQSKDFYNKIGLETDANIKKKYGILSDCDNAEVIKQYQFYEYASRHGYDLDVTVYVDENGKVIATSLDKDCVPKDADYKISMKESIELSEEELKQYIDNAKNSQIDGDLTKENSDSDSENQDVKDSVDEETKDSSDAETNGDEVKDADDNTEEVDDLKDTDEEIDNNKDVDDTNEGEDTKDFTDTSNESGEDGTTETTTDNSEAKDNSDTVSDSETPQDSGETNYGNEDVKDSRDYDGSDEVQDMDDNGSNDTEISDAEDNMSNDSDGADTTDNTADGADTSDVTDTTNKNDAGSNAEGSGESNQKNTDDVTAWPDEDDTVDSKTIDETDSDVTDTNQADAGSNKTTETTNGNSNSSNSGSSGGDSATSGSSSSNGGNTTSNNTSNGGNSTASNSSSTNGSSTSSGSTTSNNSDSNKGKTNNEKLSDNGKKLVDAYENATGEKVDLNTTPGIASKLNKCADVVDKVVGDGADLLDAFVAIGTAVKQATSGDVNGACKTLSDYGFSTLAGMGAAALATAIVGMCSVNPILGFAFIYAAGYWGSARGEDFSDWWFREVLGLYDQAGAYTYPVDPLILDLDGDGIETISVEDGVNFDFDNNGFAEKTGWVGKDDGLLVRDINGNGQIDNGGELFGDLTVAEDFTAENGFEALQYFDINGDNIINKSDEIYAQLRVWQDANQNGKVDARELHSLEELGIASFDLNYEDITETDASGNAHTQKSTYIKEDGSVAVLEDVWFGKDAADTIVVDRTQEDLLEETEAIKDLPDIRGYGNQYGLHQAMLRDETGELQSLIEQALAA